MVPTQDTNQIDPPLTVCGVEQAKKTGQFLKRYFKDYGFQFEKIIIKSSPFIRCIMTAAAVAAELEQSEVHIEPIASEILLPKMFTSNPIPLLELAQCKDIAALKTKYQIPQGVNIVGYENFVPEISRTYPESKDRGMIRAFFAQDKVLTS